MPTPDLTLDALKFRNIGPPRGGRVLAVAGHPTELATFYFGACAGGVWKSDDAGTYWTNISDGYFTSAAVGAIALAPSDPNIIYVGTGEATIRGDVSYGDGVYKSTDAGETWTHVGLNDTKHIGRIRVHPTDPDTVYVAALGHAFGPNEERGVFRSTDGGNSWAQVLFVSDKAGAIDLCLDPNNPRVLYASIYETYRNFWSLSSGGEDSGLWKSTDGGDTWVELTGKPGMPEGLKGKIGVAVSPRSGRVWAIVEATDERAGVYRSEDGGEHWTLVSNYRDLIQRPWYYCHIFADPQDADTLYVLNVKAFKSIDGGENWSEITTPHADNHDLWIDPQNPLRMIEGNDGGACVSFNGGASWSTIYNQNTAQFYHVAVDNQYPYRVLGTQQDNSSISVPSATEKGAITWSDCYAAGTGESGYITAHPDDPNIVYIGAVGSSPGGGGALQRYDHRTKQVRLITVWPEAYTGWDPVDLKYRFAWTFPIVVSPHDSGVLYATGNHVFRTTDEGDSWQAISPDLTRHDPNTLQASGGPLTLDTSGAEHYGTVFAFAESPHEAGVLWAGSDDGLVHLSRDNGDTWTNVTPPDLLEWSLISMIEPSPHNPATVYVAALRHKLDDYRPFLYKTSDYGQTWQSVSDSFPQDEITRVIRIDPVQSGLLFAGTETGIFFSLNDGQQWQRFDSNLPVVPVYDLVIKDDDLVVGTHGRSFWILDDVSLLRVLAAGQSVVDSGLVAPRTTVRRWEGWSVGLFSGPGKNYMLGLGSTVSYTEERDEYNEAQRTILDGGENPPKGAIIYYILPENMADLSLTILDGDDNVIRTFKPLTDETPEQERTLATKPGLNRFVWDLRYPNAEKIPDDALSVNATTGPQAAPGQYKVRLDIGEESFTKPLELVADPRVDVTQADLDAQFDLSQRITAKVNETHAAVNRLRRVRNQVNEWSTRAAGVEGEGDIVATADALLARLAAIENELVQTKAKTSRDSLRHKARLNVKLISLTSVVGCADAHPPQQAYDVFEHLSALVDKQLLLLDTVLAEDLAVFTAQLAEQDIPLISA